MKMKSAPVAIPAKRASQPQCRPMTSMTKAREWEEAVDEMESMDSQIRCRAVKAPIVRSVIAMSLLDISYILSKSFRYCSLDRTNETDDVQVLIGVLLLVRDSALH
jgi:hypothetical protein